MSRPARAVIAALVLATVGAFFITQHLKSTTPLIVPANPFPVPGKISPGNRACGGRDGSAVISFYLLHRADDISLYVVDPSGTIVRTLASGRHVPVSRRIYFRWDGRADNGRVVPDGPYRYRLALLGQNRTIEFRDPVTVKTVAPRPSVRRITAAGAAPAILPAPGGARIDYTGDQGHVATVLVIRTDLGTPQILTAFNSPRSPAVWDGTVKGAPAPPGTYLIGLSVTDAACNTGRFPVALPPEPGTTPGAGVTVRAVAALPPLDPVAGGGSATVLIDARRRPYTWALRLLDARHTVAHGSGTGPTLRIPVPGNAALYTLAVAAAGHRVEVPLVVSAAHPRRGAVLVVLPALTWAGRNPVDVAGDGVPVTLDRLGAGTGASASGAGVSLASPFAATPGGVADLQALLAGLDAAHLPYDLTTDLGLADGVGRGLAGHRGVLFAGSERWLPASLRDPLQQFVRGGGHVASFGVDALRRTATLTRAGGVARAVDPTPPAVADVLGATVGPFIAQSPGVVLAGSADPLRLFTGTSGAFATITSFLPITGTVPPAGKIESAAGPAAGQAAVAGWRLGAGIAVEAPIPGFGARLAGSVDEQELVRRLWTVLTR